MGLFEKGQGATEYLVLLAVVLIIALVSIALLGFFPGLATDARITQSNSYWRGEARPFTIQEHSYSGAGGTATFIVQNVDAQGQLNLLNMTISVANGTSYAYTTQTTFAPGETRTIAFTGLPSGTPGVVYELMANFSYTTPGGLRLTQYGVKNVIGKYS